MALADFSLLINGCGVSKHHNFPALVTVRMESHLKRHSFRPVLMWFSAPLEVGAGRRSGGVFDLQTQRRCKGAHSAQHLVRFEETDSVDYEQFSH